MGTKAYWMTAAAEAEDFYEKRNQAEPPQAMRFGHVRG